MATETDVRTCAACGTPGAVIEYAVTRNGAGKLLARYPTASIAPTATVHRTVLSPRYAG